MILPLKRPQIILMIGDDGIVVVPYAVPNAAPFFMPLENRHAHKEILAFIAQHPKAKITLVADNLAQDYRSDAFPRVNFIDRAKLISRRLKQNFPAARLTARVPFRKSKDRQLLIGLHESNAVFAWADTLRARLPRIALLPVEGARLIARLMPEAASGWAMLVSRQKSGGLRQIVTFKNDLVFTRLTPLPAQHDDEAATIARDIKASLDYLTRHGLRDPASLAVLLLLPGSLHADPIFKKLSLKSIRSQSPHETARSLALPFAPAKDDAYADLLFAAQLTAARPALSLMLPDTRKVWLTQTVRHGGLLLAGLALATAALGTLLRAENLGVTLYQMQKESAVLDKKHAALVHAQANASPLTEPLGRMQQALERKRIYAQPVPMPWHGLNELAGGLIDTAKITRMEWTPEHNGTPETFSVTLLMAQSATPPDRAETVDHFTRTAQDIARAMPDYSLTVVNPPYPALPQESVSAADTKSITLPSGELSLQRNKAVQ